MSSSSSLLFSLLFSLFFLSSLSTAKDPTTAYRVTHPHDAKMVQEGDGCPCADVSLCKPLTVRERKEMFVFQVNTTQYQMYDWEHLTTVAIFGGLLDEMLCYAHQRQVRLVWGTNYPTDQLTNETYQDEWVNNWVQKVQETYTDGVNIDYESPIDQVDQVNGFTQLVQKTTQAFHSQIPGSQVTVDVAWSPNCIDGRCYDYAGLANASDFVFVMDYDMRSQIPGPPCYAGANTPISQVREGMDAYFDLGIPSSKMILGVPWYGYKYPCVTPPQGSEACEIASVPFRGSACSDAAGSQFSYQDIQRTLSATEATLHFGKGASPFFNIQDENAMSGIAQYWYDDPESLSVKYEYAVRKNLRGLGMWTIDFLDYYNPDPMAVKNTARMQEALNHYFVRLQNE